MAAESGNTEGWYQMGALIEDGVLDKEEIGLLRECNVDGQILNLNLKNRIEKALYCYEQAGEQHGDALNDLGFIYQKGVRIPQEEQERNVSEWYVPPNQLKAEEYYKKAKELEL